MFDTVFAALRQVQITNQRYFAAVLVSGWGGLDVKRILLRKLLPDAAEIHMLAQMAR
ncbi:MAG: hypothetical protein ACSHWS_01545 [Sulfitobacter sp.]